jgi:hypothetical protein
MSDHANPAASPKAERDEAMIAYVKRPADSFLKEPTIPYAFCAGWDAALQSSLVRQLVEALEAIAIDIPESIHTSEVEIEQTKAAQRAVTAYRAATAGGSDEV